MDLTDAERELLTRALLTLRREVEEGGVAEIARIDAQLREMGIEPPADEPESPSARPKPA